MIEMRSSDDGIGREEVRRDLITAIAVQAMAATLDMEQAPGEGEPLPPGWQWLFFNPIVRRSLLGPDGHPEHGQFLPPIDLPRRMWAGSRLNYLADMRIGAEATRRSRIANIERKVGKAGALCFISVEHTTTSGAVACIVEEQDLVFCELRPRGEAGKPHEAQPQWSAPFTPDTALLFRYSALTFNAHRIHYDQTYAREQENYPDLVVQGPLTATLLQQFALDHGGGRRMKRFSFRAIAPLCVNQTFQLEAREDENGGLDAWVRGPDGGLAMSAKAEFE